MTEAEWRACDDPRPLQGLVGESMGLRKARLFATACCRQLWGLGEEGAMRVALASAEQLADTGTVRATKSYVRVPGGQTVLDCGASELLLGPLEVTSADGSRQQVRPEAINPVLVSVLEQSGCGGPISTWWLGWLAESLARLGLSLALQANLFRDVVRGPFRPLVFRAAWRTQNGGACVQVARAIYEEQAFDQLPVLADAFLDAGCDCDEVLDHLRGTGPHVRGCWVVDALLGKS